MQESWVLGALTLTFGLSILQGVSGNETLCDWEDFIALIGFCVITFDLLCIGGLVMCKCKGRHHDLRPEDHQAPPDPPSKAPLESIWVTSVDPLPTIRCSEFKWD